jgi:hypothetical protein
VALIVVLAMMVIIGMIVASTVAISQLDDRLTALDRDRAEAAYLAESAAARVIWLLRYDCATHPTRELGGEEILQNKDEERFMADGSIHTIAISGGQAEVAIQDMINGTDISGPTPDKALKRNADDAEFSEDEALFERHEKFINALRDYVDADSLLQLVDGFEADEYANIGRRPLPRNAPFQYREEVLWIPGAKEFFKANEAGVLDAFLILPPTLRLPPVRGKPNFFSAGADQLIKEGGFTAAEAEEIIATRERWRKEPGKLEDTFDPEILSRLQQRFSFRESGYYTLVVKASVGPDTAPRILTCSLQLSGQLAATETLRYYEWLFLQ